MGSFLSEVVCAAYQRTAHQDLVVTNRMTSLIEDLLDGTEKHTILREGLAKKKVYADKDRIGQVITNSLSNAIKYSADSNEIIVKTAATNQQVTFCVQDLGLG